MATNKDDEKRLKELAKQYGDHLVRVQVNEPEIYMRVVQKILGAKDSPVWESPFTKARCVDSYLRENVAKYSLKGPWDTNAVIVLTYIQQGDICDVFWDLEGFRIAAKTAKKGFAENFQFKMKDTHIACLNQLANNPALAEQIRQEMQVKPGRGGSKISPANLPDDKEKLLSEGVDLMQNGQLDAAITYFDKLIQLDPRDAQYYMVKGSTCINAQRFREALDAANHGIELDPNDETLLTIRATALMKVGSGGDTLNAFVEVTKRHPESKQAWWNLAIFYTAMMEGKVGGIAMDMLIINALEKVVSLDPADVQPKARLALLYSKYNDYVHALIHLEHVARANPDPRIQAFLQETKQKVAQGLSRPFNETLKQDVLASGGTIKEPVTPSSAENVCPKCREKLPPKAKFCNKCGQRMI